MPNAEKDRDYLFVSNVDIRNRKGGWDGLGGKIFDLLCDHFVTVRLLDKINPPVDFYSKAKSKLFRKIGCKANFPAFSAQRLNKIAQELEQNIQPDIDYLVFHGSTPWVHFKPKKKYCAILDCSFVTYMEVYHQVSEYSKKSLERVIDKEKAFFVHAHRIFFTSDWALKETCRQYGLDGINFKVIGQGPSITIMTEQEINIPVRNQFLFIGTDFLGKGGAEICNSFQQFLQTYPDYELVIVGQRPPEHFLQGKNIRFLGFINKSVPEGEKELENLYLESKALLLVTKKDIAPLVVIESGMHGCPSIANNVSAISEMIRDKETGLLIGNNEEEMLKGMLAIAGMNQSDIMLMRNRVKCFMTENFSWKEIIRKMIQSMREN